MKFDEYYEVKDRGLVTRTGTRGIQPFGAEALAFVSNIRVSRNSRGDGGAGRDRTGGLRLAKAALPQLSYSPMDRVSETRGWWA